MSKIIIPDAQTKGVGFAPILRHYFEKCGITDIIDQNVPLDPRRKILTHGEASVAMITSILFQVLQLYGVCKYGYSKKHRQDLNQFVWSLSVSS